MTSIQDTFTLTLRSGQDAVVKAFEQWTDTANGAWAATPGAGTPEVDPQQVIDQVFDFAEKMLAVQREFAKSLAAKAASAQTTREQSESVLSAARKRAADATEAATGAPSTDH
ncbi:MAG TPA: hypothetical protein PKY70_09895 [Nakamurella multipartita]|nr:hypothetical protein [Nakamurella multipartita]